MKFFDPSIFKIEDECGSVSLPKLMIPQFFELLFVQLLGTVNTIMLSHVSEEAVAAVGVANQVWGMIFLLLSIMKIGATIFISISFGAGRKRSASNAAGLGLFYSAVGGILMSVVCYLLAHPIMKLMNVEGVTLSYAVEYFRIRMFFMGIALVGNALLSYLRCNGHSVATFLSGTVQNLINIILGYLVIFQPFPFFLKDVWGIAYAAGISQCFGLVVALIFWKKYGFPLIFRQNKKILWRILRVGAPGTAGSASYSISQTVTTSIIASLGATMVAAKVYFSSIFFYVYIFSLSIGQAGSIMVGRYVGHKDYDSASKLYYQNLRLCIILNGLLSFMVFLFGKPLLSLFTDNPEIYKIAGAIMLTDIFVELGRAMNHIGENALNGAGDVMTPMVVAMSTCWGISVVFSYILGVRFGMGLLGCWIAFMMDEVVRGTIYFIRWHSGKWRNKI